MSRRCPHCTRRQPARVRFCPDDGHALEVDPLLDHDYQGRRIRCLLGEGAMGVVYVARGGGAEEDEALKILLARGPEATRRFQQEVQVVRALRSPHTVHLHAHGRTPDDYLYLITELVRGHTLGELLERGQRLSPRRAVRLALHICDSLMEAHALQIVHRDLKPGNVVVEVRDDGEFARVLDFGVARVRSAGSIHTEQGRVFGTPAYASPEQAVGAADLDPRSDLYSLGVLLYEMLSGRNPFLTEDAYSTLRQQMELSPAPPPGPPGLTALCMGLLAKRREERPQSAAEVRDALRGLQDTERGLQDPERGPAGPAAEDLALARARLDANLRESERLRREVRAAHARLEMDRARLDADLSRHRARVAQLRTTLAQTLGHVQAELEAALSEVGE